MIVAEHVDLVRSLYDPADNRPNDQLAEPDVIWHVPGNSPVSGTYRGLTDVFDTMWDRMQPLDDWRIDVRHVMTNGDMVIATFLLNARRGDHVVECEGANVFRMSEHGRIAEAWDFYVTQDRLDQMFNYHFED